MKKVCKYCGKVYETQSKKSYMCGSRECFNRNKREKQYTTQCEVCGKTFSGIGEKPPKYCSSECRIEGSKLNKTFINTKCEMCGKEFKTTSSVAKYCSKECLKKSAKKFNKCQYCGKEFDGNKKQKFCSLSCSSKKLAKDLYNAKIEECKQVIKNQKTELEIIDIHKGKTYSDTVFTIKCLKCGQIHTAKGKSINRKGHYGGCKCSRRTCVKCGEIVINLSKEGYCSKCNLEYRNKLKEKLKKYKRVGQCKECGKFLINERRHICKTCKRNEIIQKQEEARKERLKIDRVCRQCGQIFHSDNSQRVYCSEECAKKYTNYIHAVTRNNRLKENGTIDKTITLEKLYNRDKGICQICGQQCDYKDFKYDDKGTHLAGNNYPSIDHIIPISKGGQHIWSNVQLAHRICNTIKNNKTED